MEKTENIILFDWISFSSQIIDAQGMIEMLGLSQYNWELINGINGYQDRLYLNSINIHFNHRKKESVWLEMSGQGCRFFEEYGNGDYISLFEYIKNNPDDVAVNRIDIAYDDHLQYIKIDDIVRDTLNQNYISKSNEWEVRKSSKGTTVYIGSPKSETLIRIYDKASERGYKDDTVWTRIEIQLRKDRAKEYIKKIDTDSPGDLFLGVLVNYLRYVKPDKTDTNKSRWEMRPYWKKVIGDIGKKSIYTKPGTEYNLYQLEDYIYKKAGNAAEALIEIKGIDKFVEELKKTPRLPNKKYQRLVEREKMFNLTADD